MAGRGDGQWTEELFIGWRGASCCCACWACRSGRQRQPCRRHVLQALGAGEEFIVADGQRVIAGLLQQMNAAQPAGAGDHGRHHVAEIAGVQNQIRRSGMFFQITGDPAECFKAAVHIIGVKRMFIQK